MRPGRWAVAAAGGAALGCGGLWQESLAELWSDMTVDLEQRVAESDPNRAAAQELIDDGFVAAWEGDAGMGDAIGFSVSLQEVTEDGALHDGEIVRLRERLRAIGASPVDPARRAELLSLKQASDDEVRRRRGAPPPAAAPPFALRLALEGQGFAVGACEDGVDPGLVWTRCEAERGDLHLAAMAETYDDVAEAGGAAAEPGAVRTGNTVLTATASDRAQAMALRDQLIEGVDRLDALTDGDLRGGLEARGWAVAAWEPASDGHGSTVSCTARADGGERVAVVELVRAGGDGPLQRAVTARQATVTAGASVLTVAVEDRSAGDTLLGLLSR